MITKKQILQPHDVIRILKAEGWDTIVRSTVTRWCQNGKLQATKFNGQYYINRAHFEETILEPMRAAIGIEEESETH